MAERFPWHDARLLDRESGIWEVVGGGLPPLELSTGPVWWVAVRRRGSGRIYSGVIDVSPRDAPDPDLAAAVAEVVHRCRTFRGQERGT